jgi:hypothetical protein
MVFIKVHGRRVVSRGAHGDLETAGVSIEASTKLIDTAGGTIVPHTSRQAGWVTRR